MVDIKDQYRAVRGQYKEYSSSVKSILEYYDNYKNVVHKIESRAKDIDSFFEKSKTINGDTGNIKYTDPLKQITDLAGVRVIVFSPSQIKEISSYVKTNFNVYEEKDIGEERFQQSGFIGYQSTHMLVKMKEERLDFPEFKKFKELICEIQIRTILQHAWAEIEHDIRYKSRSSLPKSISKKFSSLAGLLEIGDREFQSIHDEYEKLRANVQDSLQTSLTLDVISNTQSTSNESKYSKGNLSIKKYVKARDLVSEREYEAAIELYSERIRENPLSHTLYIGRAKSRFLNGDRNGALEDLEHAKKLQPQDDNVDILFNQIAEGYLPVPISTSFEVDPINNLIKNGFIALSEGLGEKAFSIFEEAEELGYNYAFANSNKSLCCIVAKDFSGAHAYLSKLKIIHGTPMSINLTASKAINNCLRGHPYIEDIEELNKRLQGMPAYSFNQSPLRNLKSGLEITNQMTEDVAKIFDILDSEISKSYL